MEHHRVVKSRLGEPLFISVLLTEAFVVCVPASTDHDGKALYQEYCSSCHGIQLQGGNAQNLIDSV